jgi:exodeoxyribonuclease V beta subunit
MKKDWRTISLTPGGRGLIEASAGTGKTWTITTLYLRLLLEEALSPRQIVVTTFTDAAAAELRQRLRSRLGRAIELCVAQDTARDDGERWLQSRWQDEAVQEKDKGLLQVALAMMDVAPIGTLHSLCRRILADHPFACAMPFVPGEMMPVETLHHEVACDLWRRLQQGRPDDALRVTLEEAGLQERLAKVAVLDKALKDCLAPGVAIIEPQADFAQAKQLHFWRLLTDEARAALRTRLQLRHLLTFDELIERVHEVLSQVRPNALADTLAAAWPVALVDEFQDTDAMQFGILDAIYRDEHGKARGRLVMIADPKQAIYRFRGGDINAYGRAVAQVSDRLPLEVNFRSSRALVEACNDCFAAAGEVLSAKPEHAISYQRVVAANLHPPYTISGQDCQQPLYICYEPKDLGGVPERREGALRACAYQITVLLNSGEHAIGGQPVTPGDIAVLLPAHKDILALRAIMEAAGLPCATTSPASVFATDIAQELQVVLHGVIHHADHAALRAAAATRLWGWSYQELRLFSEEPASWRRLGETFGFWRQLWRERGVQHVVEVLLDHMAQRYLATSQGERALTDLRHLGELLANQARLMSGEEELLTWLRARRKTAAESADEAAQLRMESDRARVRLMTLHASKGLEFPIVFLPLMWAHVEKNNQSGLYLVSDPISGRRLIDVTEQAREQERQEQQDERFRVFYVALTRAMYACVLYALPPDRPARKNGRKALQGTARSPLDVLLARLSPPLLTSRLRERTPGIRWEIGWPIPAEPLRYALPRSAHFRREVRCLPAEPQRPLQARHSFTSLASRSAARGKAMTWPAPGDVHAGLAALAAVSGAALGNAVHAILEERDHALGLEAQGDLVRRCLHEHGVRSRDASLTREMLVDRLASRLQAVLETPLGLRNAPGLRLQDLPPREQRAEMGFSFLLGEVSLRALREVCKKHDAADWLPDAPDSGQAASQKLRGLLHGRIDLVFHHSGRYYLLDYKSNTLGLSLRDYLGENLEQSMAHYRLQALLYTVAVERYLRQRLGSTYQRGVHLGECVFLFIRAAGIDRQAAPDAGIWKHSFKDALLDEMDAVLAYGLQDGQVA